MKNKLVWVGFGAVALVAVVLALFSEDLLDGPSKPVGPKAAAEARRSFDKGEAIFNGSRWSDPEKAVAHYSKAIQVNPNFALAYVQRGRIYLGQLNDVAKAEEDIRKALLLDENLAEAHYALGNLDFYYSEEMEAAISSYDRSIQLKPDYYRAYINRSIALSRIGKDDEAISGLNEAIRIDPKNPLGFNTRGWSYFQMEKNGPALADFDESIRLGSKLPETYNFRGKVYQKLKREKRARADFSKACEMGLKEACGR